MFEKIKNPIIFQGSLSSKNYFEGWYYKQVNGKTGKTISFIPGVSLNTKDAHSFIQVISSPPIKTHYFRYPVDAFKTYNNPFKVQIGENIFTEEGILINLQDKEVTIEGEVKFGNLSKIKSNIINPNIMGFFAYIPKMECNHGVISMDHSIDGILKYGEETIHYYNDRGYIEKDWGFSFPREYIWIQANHFESIGDSFMMSVAKIPMGGFTFDGLIANLHYKGEEYRFATYNRGKVGNIRVTEHEVYVELKKGLSSLEVKAKMQEAGDLKSPTKGEMSNTIKEGLGGIVELTLKEKGETLDVISSPHAGIEIMGYRKTKK